MKPQSTSVRPLLIAALAGVVFAAGLALGGMMDPRKVQAFLDVGGISASRWDPSLAFVMGGALLVSLLTFSRIKTAEMSWLGTQIELPTRRDIDVRLVGGAAVFGIGWGLSGYCPGPAVASLLPGGVDIVCFIAAMATGMLIARHWMRHRETGE
jgi:uncharacterized membrane protein YedE/YeeE